MPARVIYLSAVLKVKRKQTPIPVTHEMARGAVLGLLLCVLFWLGMAGVVMGVRWLVLALFV